MQSKVQVLSNVIGCANYLKKAYEYRPSIINRLYYNQAKLIRLVKAYTAKLLL